MSWLGTLARLVVGGVWIAAGALKLPDPAESVRAVRAYRLLPEAVVPTIGHGLPILEILVGGCLVLGLLTRGAAIVSAGLLVAFIIGISSAWARGISIECGCFGGGGGSVSATNAYPWDLARDAGLLLASLYLAVRPSSTWSLDRTLLARA
ncbi:MAG: MauE/DoxX family redox-associated membrane protein [Nocardioides sp.]